MNGKQHALIGAGIYLGINYFISFVPSTPAPLAIGAGIAVLGAWLPDIDQNNSTIRQRTGTARGQGPFGVFGWVGGILAAVLGGHRAVTHTALACGLLAWALLNFTPQNWRGYVIAFVIGYVSHLVADMLTEGGVPLFWPLSKKRIGLWR